MNKRKIVVIGGGIAGLTAAHSSRKTDAKADITVVSAEKHPPYCKPSLACVVRGTSFLEDIGLYSHQMLESKRIRLVPNCEVYSIRPEERVVKARETSTRRILQLDYDSLVLAVGGHDFVPRVEGNDLQGVFTLQTFDDALRIYETAKSGKSAIVVGAGPIALSITEALTKRRIRVTMIVRSRLLRTLVEPDLSSIVQKKVQDENVTCLVNAEVEKILGSKRVESVKVAGENINTSMVVFGTGIRASTKLAENAGIKVGKYGIQVDEHMRTSSPDVFSAGDCTETIDFVTKKRTYLPIGSIAAQEGTVAGTNAAGVDVRTEGFLRVQADNLFGTEITSIGHNSESASALGIKVDVSKINTDGSSKDLYDMARKYPTQVRIVTDNTDRIIGVQTLGRRIAAQERFMLFRAIKTRMDKREIAKLLKMD